MRLLLLLTLVSLVTPFSPATPLQAAGPLSFGAPIAVAVSRNGSVYVADQKQDRIVRLSPAGALTANWGSPGAGKGQFDGPTSLVVDGHGRVYVGDAGNSRIEEFSGGGKFLRSWHTPAVPNGGWVPRLKLALDRHGNVYAFVPIYGGATLLQLWKYSPQGKRLGHMNIDVPYALTPDASQPVEPLAVAVDRHGSIYVALLSEGGTYKSYYSQAYLLQKHSPGGKLIWQWGTDTSDSLLPVSGAFCDPEGMLTDPRGNIWLTDSCKHRVEEVSPTGKLLGHFGSQGCGPGKFEFPASIALDGKGNVYVADRDAGAVQKLSATGKPLALWGTCH